nr:hypothetical protein [Tanacetum cinerariifolium]
MEAWSSMHSHAEIFKGLARMGYEKPSDKLTFYKAFFSPKWKFLIHTILQCLSAKIISWNEFSSTVAYAIVCLATNQKFNFSRYILLSLVKNIEAGVPFFMFHRFVPLIINHQLGDMTYHKNIFATPSLTKKVFSNMKRVSTGFSGEVTSLFDNMLVQAPEKVGMLQADAQSIRIPTEPSTSKPQKKHKPKRKHTKEPKVPPTESLAEHNLPSPTDDPLPSGEDSLKLKELMDFCTNLSNKVLDLKSKVIDIKSTYQARIDKLESRVERLEEENRVLKKLMGVHSKVDSDELAMEKEESSKQGRKIADIDDDVEFNLEKARAEAYNLDLDHQEKVLSMMGDNDEEPADVEEVLEVVKAAKLIIEVVTTVGVDVNAASVQDTPITAVEATKVSVPRKRRESSKKEGDSLEQEIAKKQKMKQETEELKKHLQIVPVDDDDDDDVYTNATPLASKIPIIDYKIHTERNRPYFKIIRADGNHRLFLSFGTMLKNFDREDLESLWNIVRERFAKIEPKNYSDDFLLNTLKIIFEKPNVEANIFLLVERMYPLTRFTPEQMINDVRLKVEDESEISLELLRIVRRQLNEGYVP